MQYSFIKPQHRCKYLAGSQLGDITLIERTLVSPENAPFHADGETLGYVDREVWRKL